MGHTLSYVMVIFIVHLTTQTSPSVVESLLVVVAREGHYYSKLVEVQYPCTIVLRKYDGEKNLHVSMIRSFEHRCRALCKTHTDVRLFVKHCM